MFQMCECKKILNDICYQIQGAIGEKPLVYKITYDVAQNLFAVENAKYPDAKTYFRTYQKAVVFVAYDILQDSATELKMTKL